MALRSSLLQSLVGGSWLTTGLYLIGAAIAILFFYRAYFHPLARFPGPRIASVTILWQLYHNVIGDWHEIILPLHQKYGRIVRLAPNELSIVDEAAMKTIYGHGSKETSVKGNWYQAWQPPKAAPNILATQDERLHAESRKTIVGAFKMTSIIKMEPLMQICLDNLHRKLYKLAEDSEVVDMCVWTDALAWDIVSELCYGETLGMLEGKDTMGLRKTMFINFFVSSVLGHVPGKLKWISNPLTEALGLGNPLDSFFSWSAAKVRQHKEEGVRGDHEDLMDIFIAYRDSKGQPVSDERLVDNATATIAAGADTVSVAMRSALFYLSVNPKMLARLQQDIDRFCTKNNVTEPLTYNQTQQLPYLRAVVRESLRMMPSIPAQLPRYVASSGLNIDGHYIKPGTLVGISPLAQNYDKAIFGQDVNTFRPERWLEDETKSRHLETALMNFGGTGARSCLGRDLALVELYKLVAQTVQKFDFKVVDEKKPLKAWTYFFTFQSEMWMEISLRNKTAV